jgi:hypothetical protein
VPNQCGVESKKARKGKTAEAKKNKTSMHMPTKQNKLARKRDKQM